ncbi:MAG TPA: galactokinase [Levilinea sp.]|nr:galactokinase [Levilinea sp.]
MFDQLLPNASLRATAPGRVNLLGEHVDYNDGAVLPAAIDRAVHLVADRQTGRLAEIWAIDLKQSIVLDLDRLDSKQDAAGKTLPHWALYPAGVAWAFQQAGFETPGIKAAFTSNVPIGSGLSSSAAVEVAFAAVWRELGGAAIDNLTLAKISQKAENLYVGVNSGLMDQFASANGVAGHAVYFNTRTLAFEPVPIPNGAVIVIADSKVRRSLTSSAYNERRAACEEAVRLLAPALPHLRALCDITPAELALHAHLLPDIIHKRACHVVEECARVEEAVKLLKAGDAVAFGKIMVAGHISLRDLYEVSVAELDALVEIALEQPGCYGARLTGAGFGGCTVNLVAEDHAADFITSLMEGYTRRSGRQADVYLCRASQGVTLEVRGNP